MSSSKANRILISSKLYCGFACLTCAKIVEISGEKTS